MPNTVGVITNNTASDISALTSASSAGVAQLQAIIGNLISDVTGAINDFKSRADARLNQHASLSLVEAHGVTLKAPSTPYRNSYGSVVGYWVFVFNVPRRLDDGSIDTSKAPVTMYVPCSYVPSGPNGNVSSKASDVTYVVPAGGKTLEEISTIYYTVPDLWWVIAKINNITNVTAVVAAGTSLKVPTQARMISEKILVL